MRARTSTTRPRMRISRRNNNAGPTGVVQCGNQHAHGRRRANVVYFPAMHGIRSTFFALVFLVVPTVVFAQYDPYFGTYDTPYVDYSSPTWTRTPESVTRPSGSSGSTGGATGGTTTGTSPSSGTTDAASISIPAGATEVWVQPGPEPRKVFYAPEGTVEEPRAAADTTLRKIYVRSPLGQPNYTQPVGVFDSYDKGYIYRDKLEGKTPVLIVPAVPQKPAVAPTPIPAKPVPPASTVIPVETAPVPVSVPAEPVAPIEPEVRPAPPVAAQPQSLQVPSQDRTPVTRRIARGISTMFRTIVRFFQRFGS